jgi:hypothetical protein
MKDTLKEVLVDCLNAGKKGSKTGVDPSMYPSQVNIYIYFLSVKIKQSDWLRSLSERAGFLHPARSETQRTARCEMQLPALVFAPKTEE